MYNTNILQRIYLENFRDGRLTRTGRRGIRDTLAGEVVYTEYALPNGMTIWHGKGIPCHVTVGQHSEYLAELPEKWLLAEPPDLPDGSGELVEPYGTWDAPDGAIYNDWTRTRYYTASGDKRAYARPDVYYCSTEKFLSARGCDCEARFDESLECECDPDCYEDLHIIKWLRRVRGGWELMSEPPAFFGVVE